MGKNVPRRRTGGKGLVVTWESTIRLGKQEFPSTGEKDSSNKREKQTGEQGPDPGRLGVPHTAVWTSFCKNKVS